MDHLNELNLKVLTSLSNLVADEERGLITGAEVKTAVRSIFDCMGGYLAPETFETLSVVSDRYKNSKAAEFYMIQHPQADNLIAGMMYVPNVDAIIQIREAHRMTPQYNLNEERDKQNRDIFIAYKRENPINRKKST